MDFNEIWYEGTLDGIKIQHTCICDIRVCSTKDKGHGSLNMRKWATLVSS